MPGDIIPFRRATSSRFAGRLRQESADIAPVGSADVVLTFRNLHNWLEQGYAPEALAAIYRALKPGGMLGIEDHRGHRDTPPGKRQSGDL